MASHCPIYNPQSSETTVRSKTPQGLRIPVHKNVSWAVARVIANTISLLEHHDFEKNTVEQLRYKPWNSECYSDPCILRPPIQPEKYCLKLKVVLKCSDVYIENVREVSMMACPKTERILK